VTIVGIEAELNLAILKPGSRAQRKKVVAALVNSLPGYVPAVRAAPSPTSPAGYMTSLGSKIYVDGEYLEVASAEVRAPLEALIGLRANEQFLLIALASVTTAFGLEPKDVKLIRACTDYAGQFRGFHQNFLTRQYEVGALVEHLVPFLVTRFASCAGGLGPSGFVMSQKNGSVRCVASPDSREDRGIVHLKRESLSRAPFKRIHIAHGDANMSEVSALVSLGSTALVIKMLDAGVCIGPAYKLHDPLKALRILDRDIGWSTPLPLASGSKATALEIQRHFLEAAEAYVPRQREPWMRQVVTLWREALDALRLGGPDALSRSMDPWIKRWIYAMRLREHGITLEDFSSWCPAVSSARSFLNGERHRDVRGHLRSQMPSVVFDFLEDRVQRAGLSWQELPWAIALYDEMMALDLSYHELGPEGLYFRLCEGGFLDSSMISPSQISDAMERPPLGTRAEARGRAIRDVAGDPKAVADWHVLNTGDRRATFADPFVTACVLSPIAKKV
jgi:hypothetical protein